jgi:trk system potassium uptake protein
VTTTAGRPERRIVRARHTAVDVKGSVALVGLLVKYLSVASLVPAAFAVGYGEPVHPFLLSGALAAVVGWGLERGFGGAGSVGFREGYLVVAATWLAAAVFGALPFVLSGEPQLDRPLDALFESMSGFTTTGLTVLTDVEGLDRSVLIWRQFTQWLGGMGIIVLALAVLPRLRVGGRQLLESELPGPEIDQLADRIRDTARRLWLLYTALTFALFVILTAIGLLGDERIGAYDALGHALTTMPTGGFSTRSTSVQEFGAAVHWVLVVFMLLAGANAVLLYRAFVRRQPGAALRDEELRSYALFVLFGAVVLSAVVWAEGLADGERAIRAGVFEAVSTVTTTGFTNVAVGAWPTLGLITIVALMFAGGCAGSPTGSIKAIRHVLMGKSLRRELRQTVHPEEIVPVRVNRRVVDERTLRAATVFILLYVGIFVGGVGVLAVDTAIQGPDLSAIDVFATAAMALGNVGPVLGTHGPLGTMAEYGDVSTVTMTVLMWMGRLEVIPVVVLLTRRYWRV